MKTTKSNNQGNHVGLRLDDESLQILDGLCEAVGGASRSRVLRRLLLWVKSDPSDRYTDEDGKPVESNAKRRQFVEMFRRLDDAIIKDMTASLADSIRRK